MLLRIFSIQDLPIIISNHICRTVVHTSDKLGLSGNVDSFYSQHFSYSSSIEYESHHSCVGSAGPAATSPTIVCSMMRIISAAASMRDDINDRRKGLQQANSAQ